MASFSPLHVSGQNQQCFISVLNSDCASASNLHWTHDFLLAVANHRGDALLYNGVAQFSGPFHVFYTLSINLFIYFCCSFCSEKDAPLNVVVAQ